MAGDRAPRASLGGAQGEPIDPIAGALAAACRDPEVLARLAGSIGEAARAANAIGYDHKQRMRWASSARTPVPAGLRGVHGSWVEAGLEGLPARARGAVASGGGIVAADAWLARWATSAIPPMLAVDATERWPSSIDAAVRLDAARLRAWLERVGADQLALALGAAGGDAVASAVRVVGPTLRDAVVRIAKPPRLGALGSARAAIARSRVELDDRALVRIGARAIAPYVDALARLRLMHRLPRAIGLAIGEALMFHGAPLSDAPRWTALAA